MLGTNIVEGKELREVQQKTLNTVKNALLKTFGPNGSTTVIKKSPQEFANTTKDGHTVLTNIKFPGVIESTVVQQLTELTTHIVKTVGDGTTSAIVLSSIIFDALVESNLQAHPSAIIKAFKEAVDDIIKIISEKDNQELTLEDVYNIALTSTNNNEFVSNTLYNIYKEYGTDVFIDVGISNDENTKIKEYNGTTLKTGYLDPVMITNQAKGTAELPNPKIYIFRDPIDTPDIVNLLNAIIKHNILDPMTKFGDINKCVNTVIMAPKISSDLAQMMNDLILQMHTYKVPLLIITNIVSEVVYEDLIVLTGAKPINRYIDPALQKIDIEKGLAPTIENISTFAGSTELIVSDATSTKFIRPANMYKEGTMEYTEPFTNLIRALEGELKMAYENNESAATIGKLKRRINSLKANMVELLIGGVSVADRDSVRDLVEDAVKSLRSANEYGVGNGSNYEGYKASSKLFSSYMEDFSNPNHTDEDIINITSIEELPDKHDYSALYYDTSKNIMYEWNPYRNMYMPIVSKSNPYFQLKYACIHIITEAYMNLLAELYIVSGYSDKQIEQILNTESDYAFNIRTGQFDGKVLTSIESDKVILSTISKIVTLMYTSNQFLLPDPVFNNYKED